jgi:hypothetical protein
MALVSGGVQNPPPSLNVTARPGRYLHLAMEDRAAEIPFREKA